MFLEARKFVSSFSNAEQYQELLKSAGFRNGDLPHSNFATINIEAMYWRKVNAVHDWFVREVQGGEDDCGTYRVSREQLQELVSLCNKVLLAADEETAQELLPTASGFFFGGTDYEEYYYEGLSWTVEGLTKILQNPAFDSMEFYYSSSW